MNNDKFENGRVSLSDEDMEKVIGGVGIHITSGLGMHVSVGDLGPNSRCVTNGFLKMDRPESGTPNALWYDASEDGCCGRCARWDGGSECGLLKK